LTVHTILPAGSGLQPFSQLKLNVLYWTLQVEWIQCKKATETSCTEPLQVFQLIAWPSEVCGSPEMRTHKILSSKEGWLPFIHEHDRPISHLVR